LAALLQVRDLSLGYATPRGRVRALRAVDLDVEPGQVVGIVGESGSGKSTLVAAVIGLLSANALVEEGEIRFEGRDLLALSPDELRQLRGQRISMVFQDPMAALNPVLSIGRQAVDIQYRAAGLSKPEKRARAIDMLRRVGIPDPERRMASYPHELSGGMRQRVCIAMALIAHPALLIADEPTTALDVTTEAQIIELLREVRALVEGSILFISHHLGLVAELCDCVVVMYAGEVVENGPVREVFHRPGHPYTRALLACDPARIETATRELPTIPGDVPNLVEPPRGCAFRARCPHAFERCHEHPPLYDAGVDHVARCFLLDHG
jgi:oligopeptide/dipeptide ABC transporter ATP-binding protein